MAITCMLSHTYHDLRCPVCGEGFLILADTGNIVSRMQIRRKVGQALRADHTSAGATHVHPTQPFQVTGDDCGPLEWLHTPLTFPAPAAAAA